MREDGPPALTPQELAAAGEALYGAGWRAQLADAFGVPELDIVRVERGQAAAPRDWRARLVMLAQDAALRALDAASTLLWRECGAELEREAATGPRQVRYI
jgi:hypothetical protein